MASTMRRRSMLSKLVALVLLSILLQQVTSVGKGLALTAPGAIGSSSVEPKVTVSGERQVRPCVEEALKAIGVTLTVVVPQGLLSHLFEAENADFGLLAVTAPVLLWLVWQLYTFWRSALREVVGLRPLVSRVAIQEPREQEVTLLREPQVALLPDRNFASLPPEMRGA
mmetsp:Transcript_758/g.1604  ORF Transcript_758/g.1604 Transcript_758/m.1604 type:complete len:169 (+) Transcript_758:99-605(+)